jgi:hypothetical protein
VINATAHEAIEYFSASYPAQADSYSKGWESGAAIELLFDWKIRFI